MGGTKSCGPIYFYTNQRMDNRSSSEKFQVHSSLRSDAIMFNIDRRTKIKITSQKQISNTFHYYYLKTLTNTVIAFTTGAAGVNIVKTLSNHGIKVHKIHKKRFSWSKNANMMLLIEFILKFEFIKGNSFSFKIRFNLLKSQHSVKRLTTLK